MTHEHLSALLGAGEATKNAEGWMALPDGRSVTLYLASGSSTLSIGRVHTLKQEGSLLHARTAKGEHFVVALEDTYAGSVDAPSGVAKKAGFL
jgi:hypothetical protein